MVRDAIGEDREVEGHTVPGLNFERVLDMLADPVIAAGADNHILYANRAVLPLLGWEPGELIGRSLTVIIPERFRATHNQAFERFVTTGVSHIMGTPIRVPALARSGQEIDIELSLSSFPGRNDQLIIVGTLRDLRVRIELERQLEVTRLLRAATQAAAGLPSRLELPQVLESVVTALVKDFDAALARVWLYDQSQHMLHLQASAGLSHEIEHSTRAHLDVTTYPYKLGQVARTLQPFICNDLEGDAQFEQDWVEREGIASVAALPLAVAGELLGVLVYFSRKPLRDETVEVLLAFATIVASTLQDVRLFQREQEARREAEEARTRVEAVQAVTETALVHLSLDDLLTELLDRIRTILQADEATILLVTEDGAGLQVRASLGLEGEVDENFVVPMGQGIAGRVAAEGQPRIVPDLQGEEVMSPWLRHKVRSLVAAPLVASDQTIGVIHVGTRELRTFQPADAQLLQLVADRAATAIERTRLFELERAARETMQEAERSREVFVSTLSHDLKNPLTTILAQAQVLQRRMQRLQGSEQEIERMTRGLHHIQSSAARLNRLVNDLVDATRWQMSRQLSLQRRPVDLVALAGQLIDEYRHTNERHRISLVSALPELTGEWDPDRLERILSNLLNNACKYTPEGGIVTVRVGQEGAQAVLAVEDEGIGIPAADLDHIFERFTRGSNVVGRFPGSGIGLEGVKTLVEQHGGSIEVESREGEGSTFTIRLPL